MYLCMLRVFVQLFLPTFPFYGVFCYILYGPFLFFFSSKSDNISQQVGLCYSVYTYASLVFNDYSLCFIAYNFDNIFRHLWCYINVIKVKVHIFDNSEIFIILHPNHAISLPNTCGTFHAD